MHVLNIIGNDRILIESDGPNAKVFNQRYHPNILETIYNEVQKFCDYDFKKKVYENFYKLLMD